MANVVPEWFAAEGDSAVALATVATARGGGLR
jgi:hypothetical protein